MVFFLSGKPEVPAACDDGVYWSNTGGVGCFVVFTLHDQQQLLCKVNQEACSLLFTQAVERQACKTRCTNCGSPCGMKRWAFGVVAWVEDESCPGHW